MSSIANKLRTHREELGISREALAEECGISSKTIQRAEEGEDISEATIKKIENALGVSLREIYTEAQEKAITSNSDNLLVIAGAGAGKTKVIEARIVHLIESGVEPNQIIAWSFTEKAAKELNLRVKRLLKQAGLEKGTSDMIIGTIHSSCLRLLQEYTDKYNGYQVLTPIQNLHFVNRYFNVIGVGNIKRIDNDTKMRKYVDTLKFIKIVNIVTENPTNDSEMPAEIKNAIENYKKELEKNKYFDFTTIQEAMLFELNNNTEFREKIKEIFKYIIVDEYQDVNYLQEQIISNIIALGVKSSVVGDADQAIYQFRGSDYTNIINFDQRYANVEVVKLEDNFRSTEGIVDIAQSVIKYNKNRRDKDMRSANGGYELGDITYKRFHNADDESIFIVERIKELISIGMNLNEIAILLRKNDMAENIIEKLESNEIPYLVENVNNLLETKEILACISIFKFLNGTITKEMLRSDWVEVDSTIKHEYIDEAIKELEQYIPKRWISSRKFVVNQEYLIQQIFYSFFYKLDIKESSISNDEELEKILFNIGKFTQLINDFETINFDMQPEYKIGLFCSFLEYSNGQYPEGYLDNVYSRAIGIRIMTVHKSKGLQFSAVFVPGLTKNVFPIKRIGGLTEWHFLPFAAISNYKVIKAEGDTKKESDTKQLEDERRLFYVAITRSRKFLFLTGAPYNRQCVTESTFVEEARDARGYIFEFNNNCYDIASRKKWRNIDNKEVEMFLDFSTLADYYMCPYKFKLSQIYGFVQPINLRMGYGNSVHNMAKEINKYALSAGDLTEEQLKKIIEHNFHLPYIGVWNETKKLMFENAKECIQEYVKKNRKDFKDIEFVEKYIEIEVDKNVLVSGRIDLVLKRDIAGNVFVYVIDYKTNENANTEVENKIQTNIYSLGYKGVTDQYPDFVEIVNIDKNKTISTQPVDKKQLDETIQSIKEAYNQITTNKLEKCYNNVRCKICHKRGLCLTRNDCIELEI